MTTTQPTAAALVVMAGRALYGTEWQSELARGLGVQLRTVQRVAAAAEAGGDYPAARAWLDDLQELINTQARDLGAVAGLIRAAARR